MSRCESRVASQLVAKRLKRILASWKHRQVITSFRVKSFIVQLGAARVLPTTRWRCRFKVHTGTIFRFNR